MKEKIRQYILQNIPYLFAVWFFLKIGTAYRIAEGANFGTKLVGMLQTINTAFGTITPGFNGFDWLIGIVGAVILRAIVYFKVKKAKNSEGMWNTARRVGVRKKI